MVDGGSTRAEDTGPVIVPLRNASRANNVQPEVFTFWTEAFRRNCNRAVSQNSQCREENAKPNTSGSAGTLYALVLCMQNNTKKILIADGDGAFRESLRTFIKGLGHEVFEAATGPDAIDKVGAVHPDLIIMDVRLPGMNGDEVTRQLKKNLSTRHIPVVINTGWTTACNVEERIDRALNAGASEVVYKPLQFPILRDVMRTYLFA